MKSWSTALTVLDPFAQSDEDIEQLHEREEAMIYALDEENNFYRAQFGAILKHFMSWGLNSSLPRLIVCISSIESMQLSRQSWARV